MLRAGMGSVAVSVVTVTNRPGSIDVTWSALESQRLQDFEWVLCDELYSWRRDEVAAAVADCRLRHVPAPVVEDDLWNLNKSYNEALRHCSGLLVVSLQDYIWVPPDGLQRFWDLFCEHGPRLFASGVGHAYRPPPARDPRGKVTIFERPWSAGAAAEHEWVRTGTDVRHPDDDGGLVDCGPDGWELNWGAAPLEAFYEIGGFPEDHDRRFVSCDNLSVAYAAESRDYRFLLDRGNECRILDHREVFARDGWEERHGKRGEWRQWLDEWTARGRPAFPYLVR
ncbi:MAG TPA: hypothetical protein VFJ85_12015 [Acidimicrobiales bacterium]|nr:hypothetical protein [Acidimicrobiales bacterium]